MMNKLHILLIIILLNLSGCTNPQPPIEPDDFGFPKFFVSASGYNITGTQANELSEWLATGYHYNGSHAAISVFNHSDAVSSSWCSWYGSNESTVSELMQTNSNCIITPPKSGDQAVTIDSSTPPPCNFVKGQGLYLLVSQPACSGPQCNIVSDPNANALINRNPSTPQMGALTLELSGMNYGLADQGEAAAGFNGELSKAPGASNSTNYIGGEAYFKILDNYYSDNSGGYNVALKYGFTSDIPPPIQYILNILTKQLEDTAAKIFINLVENNDYLTILKVLLTLYIVIMGVMFTGGLLQITAKELLNSLFKILIVTQLLTTTSSWKFFDQYFFTFFIDGLVDFINVITSTLNITGGPNAGLIFFDQFLDLMFSRETWLKISALIFTIPSGIVVAFILAVGFGCFTITIARSVILYLLAMIATSLLIILAPIFIPMLLFKTTRSLFEGWMTQFANYFFQVLLVFTSLTLFYQAIISQMYKILGFGACFNNFISLSNGSWFFGVYQICKTSTTQMSMAVPGYGFWNNAIPTQFYSPYSFTVNRYIDLPFLDPSDTGSLYNGLNLINAFLNNPAISLNVPMLYNSAILTLLCYLSLEFNGFISDIGKGIAGAASSINTGQGNALVNAANSGPSDLYSGASNLGSFVKSRTIPNVNLNPLKQTARGEALEKGLNEFAKKTQEALRFKIENKYLKAVLGEEVDVGKGLYKSASFISNRIIPPLSLDSGTLTGDQEQAWAAKAQHERETGVVTLGDRVHNAAMAPLNAVQDNVAGTIRSTSLYKASNAVGRSLGSNPVGSALGFKAGEESSKYDSNIGITGSAKAFGSYIKDNLTPFKGRAGISLDEALINQALEPAGNQALEAAEKMNSHAKSGDSQRENIAILKALGVDKEDRHKLQSDEGVAELLARVPQEKLTKMRDLMNDVRFGGAKIKPEN